MISCVEIQPADSSVLALFRKWNYFEEMLMEIQQQWKHNRGEKEKKDWWRLLDLKNKSVPPILYGGKMKQLIISFLCVKDYFYSICYIPVYIPVARH